MTTDDRLAAATQHLLKDTDRFERRRRALFYISLLAQLITACLVIFVLLQSQNAADQRASDSAKRGKVLAEAIAQISNDRRLDTNAQTLALEKFILAVVNGEHPTPDPVVVFPTKGTTTPSSSSPRAPAPARTSPSAPKPSPARTAAPRPSATPRATPRGNIVCRVIQIPLLPVC